MSAHHLHSRNSTQCNIISIPYCPPARGEGGEQHQENACPKQTTGISRGRHDSDLLARVKVWLMALPEILNHQERRYWEEVSKSFGYYPVNLVFLWPGIIRTFEGSTKRTLIDVPLE